MVILVRLVLFLLLALMAVRALMRFVAGFMVGVAPTAAQPRPSGEAAKAGHMVKDPVCGTYVVEGQALTAVRGGQKAWFCSPRCQAAWLHGKAS